MFEPDVLLERAIRCISLIALLMVAFEISLDQLVRSAMSFFLGGFVDTQTRLVGGDNTYEFLLTYQKSTSNSSNFSYRFLLIFLKSSICLLMQ